MPDPDQNKSFLSKPNLNWQTANSVNDKLNKEPFLSLRVGE